MRIVTIPDVAETPRESLRTVVRDPVQAISTAPVEGRADLVKRMRRARAPGGQATDLGQAIQVVKGSENAGELISRTPGHFGRETESGGSTPDIEGPGEGIPVTDNLRCRTPGKVEVTILNRGGAMATTAYMSRNEARCIVVAVKRAAVKRYLDFIGRTIRPKRWNRTEGLGKYKSSQDRVQI